MSENDTSWFHCGRCGSLFLSRPGELEERYCTSCGCDPSLGIEQQPGPHTLQQRVALEESAARHNQRQKHSPRRKKGGYLVFKIAAAWVLVLAAIVFGAKALWKTPEKKPDFVNTNAPVPIPDGDIELLQNGGPQAFAAFSAFLAAGTPEQRNQFVLSPVTTAARMARFYAKNPIEAIDPQSVGVTGQAVVHFPTGKPGIETQWRTIDGRNFDAVFREQEGEWRLDWDHFVRFSEDPWPLFLAGGGEAEGEFRLLARERLAAERKADKSLSLVFYAPRFGHAKEVSAPSPEFLVDRSSRDGQLLEAAFQMARDGKRVFGVRLPALNPDGMIRVRASFRRVERDGRRSYELDRLIACHWYSVDEPGVEISTQTTDD